MQCKYYKHLIVLAGIKNISHRQEKQLQAHIGICNRCKREWEQQLQTDKALQFVRSNQVSLRHPQELTDRICNALERRPGPTWQGNILNFLDQMNYFLFFRRLKYALVTVASFLVILFVLQHFSILNRNARYKKDEMAVAYAGTGINLGSVLYRKASIKRTGIIEALSRKDKEMIEINKTEYTDLINIILSLEKENSQLREKLGDEYNQILTNIETQYKKELTQEEKTLLKKLKEI